MFTATRGDTRTAGCAAQAGRGADSAWRPLAQDAVRAEAAWTLEPSLQYDRDRTPQGSTNQRCTPGLRVTYRRWERWALESSLTCELGKSLRVATDPTLTVTTKESSTRANFALGARYSF
jgi:hypothetical protein